MAELTEAELKVGLFIFRRTEGYHKPVDAISLSQFENGILSRDGKVIDNGTGLSRQSITIAIRGLEAKNLIKVIRSKSQCGDWDTNRYSLNTDHSERLALVDSVSKTSTEQPPVSEETTIEETVVEPNERDRTLVEPDGSEPAVAHREQPPPQVPREPTLSQADRLLEKLIEAGVIRSVAEDLVARADLEEITRQLTFLPYSNARNPGALAKTHTPGPPRAA
jgi:hypothetical protein